MTHSHLDRTRLRIEPLQNRKNKVYIERDQIPVTARPRDVGPSGAAIIAETAARIHAARAADAPRMLAFGAHSIKNGLAPVFIRLIESGWITHLATNGAGIIHDWEFAFQGSSSEDVRANVAEGRFGIWEETGRWINLAIIVGAYEGAGYGEAVGRFVEEEGLDLPSRDALLDAAAHAADDPARAAAACDLLDVVARFNLPSGRLSVPHPFKRFGLQAAAYRLGVPFTGHPMFGHDIIYCHPMNHGAAIGRTAERDFLRFADSVSRLDGGVYLSVGSAVMSPMVFEKSLSMAQNLALQEGRRIERHFMVVVDLQASHWDWSKGEPPEDNPDYYLRYCKSFARMGGEMRYLSADNRDFLLALLQHIESITPDEDWQGRGAPR